VTLTLWWLDQGATALRRDQIEQAIDEFSSIEAIRVVERNNGQIYGLEMRRPEVRLRRRLLRAEPLIWSLPLTGLLLYGWLHVPLEQRAADFYDGLVRYRGQTLPADEVQTLTGLTAELTASTVSTSPLLGNLFLALHQLKIDVEPMPEFTGAALQYANLSRATYENICLERADLSRSRAIGSDLDGAELTEADLREADWSKASLVGAFLREVRAEKSSWDYADLTRADFSLALLRGASFRNAILRDAEFGGADLRGADFRGADLRGAKLEEAMLDNALLDGALLEGTILTGMVEDRNETGRQASIGPGR